MGKHLVCIRKQNLLYSMRGLVMIKLQLVKNSRNSMRWCAFYLCFLFLIAPLSCRARSEQLPPLGTSHAYFTSAMCEIEQKKYDAARSLLLCIEQDFPCSKDAENSCFWLGVVEFERGHIEHADEYFGKYLRTSSEQIHFQRALEYRYFIAERLAYGQKVRPLKIRSFPRILSGEETAIEILEDITNTVQTHDLSARSYYLKGYLYWKNLRYRDSIENYQSLIKKFPKHELAADAHLAILYAWKCIAVREPYNPDTLQLASISFEEFRASFPSSSGLIEGEEILESMKEVFARALVRTGRYYLRRGKPGATKVYFERTVALYPQTKWANYASSCLETLL